jgi:hypothetical protein
MPRTITIATTWRMAEPWWASNIWAKTKKNVSGKKIVEERDGAIRRASVRSILRRGEKRFHLYSRRRFPR